MFTTATLNLLAPVIQQCSCLSGIAFSMNQFKVIDPQFAIAVANHPTIIAAMYDVLEWSKTMLIILTSE